MSAERPTPGVETNATANSELVAARADKLAELNAAFSEAEPAQAAEKRAEQAREVIGRQTEVDSPSTESVPGPAAHRLSHLNHRLNYAQTVASMQRKLPEIGRALSRVIHTPAIEKTSEVLETTIARPSVMLGSTWTALIVGTIFYLGARHYGYSLSGSELLFSFVVGALFGLVGEGLVLAFKRR